MKSLIVDSPESPSEFGVLLSQQFEAPTRCRADEALGRLDQDTFDAIFLDQTRMKRDAATLCSAIRAAHEALPIMLINAEVSSEEIVRGLTHGADDYVIKPMVSREFTARVRALLRRSRLGSSDRLRYGDLELDLRGRVATRGEHVADLTSCEFLLLHLLMRHQGEVVSRAAINEHIWGNGRAPASNSIEAHVCSLRRKIDMPGMERVIVTVPRRGYRLGTGAKGGASIRSSARALAS